jgi:hypothetical protein
MFTKHVSELTYSDIDDLINVRQEREGYHLDYKGKIGEPDKFKKEFSKDISSFGNTGGGYLVIGVDKESKIVGIDPIIMNKPVDEWFNQVLSTNIDPPVFYYNPKVIPIPDSDKIIVVIHVPESSKKPHMVSETHQYNIRINDSSKPSTHNQVRDMFDYSRYKTEEYRNFLIKRNLYDEDDPNFGQNRLTKQLHSIIPEKLNISKPLVIFSLIPKYPNEERIKIPFHQFRDWLEKNNQGYEPSKNLSLFNPYREYELKLDGVVFKGMDRDNVISYFEISNNGYIEVGFSLSMTNILKDENENSFPILFWTHIIGFEWLLLEFSRRFYDFLKFYDDVEIQMSLVDVLNYRLLGWDSKKYDWRLTRFDDTVNKHHNSFKVNTPFNPKIITEEQVRGIIKDHSMRLGRGFGLEHDYCIDNQGNINVEQLRHLFY